MDSVPDAVLATHILSRLGPVERVGLAMSSKRFRDLEHERLRAGPLASKVVEALRMYSAFLKIVWQEADSRCSHDVGIEVNCVSVFEAIPTVLTVEGRRDMLMRIDSQLGEIIARSGGDVQDLEVHVETQMRVKNAVTSMFTLPESWYVDFEVPGADVVVHKARDDAWYKFHSIYKGEYITGRRVALEEFVARHTSPDMLADVFMNVTFV